MSFKVTILGNREELNILHIYFTRVAGSVPSKWKMESKMIQFLSLNVF